MPAIVELRLFPSRPVAPTSRQLHGLACTLFEGPMGALGEAIHASQEKPFSVWPLRKAPGGWLLRSAWLPHGFPHAMLAACGQVRLGPVACTIADIAFRPATHAGIADVPLADGARLTLLSPAYFSRSGSYVAEADPRLIVGSWRRRWNASLPAGHELAVSDELFRDIHLALHVTGSGLRTESRDNGYHPRAGLTGTATLRLESGASPAVRRGFATLARFAEYSGTGAQVTHGFGATRTTLLHSSWAHADRSQDHDNRPGPGLPARPARPIGWTRDPVTGNCHHVL
jgi:CRISPR-associated endoribonuclease Cas6